MTGTVAWEWLFDPPALFDAVVYGTDPELWEGLAERYEVVALPGTVPGDLEPGDLVVRRALGEGRAGDVVPADPAVPLVAPGARLPHDRLVLRPRLAPAGCGCATAPAAEQAPAGTCGCSAGEADAEASPPPGTVTCVPAAEPDPAGRGPHPLIRRRSKRPAVGYAQQCLGRWMTGHATTLHTCGDPAYVEQAFRRLRTAGQFPLVVDCDFGSNTDLATRAFQSCVRVDRDGAIGPITWPRLKAFDPAAGGGGGGGGTAPPLVVPGRISEIDVDSTFELFAEFFMPAPGSPTSNVFKAADRAALGASPAIATRTAELGALATGGVLATDPSGDFLLSLRGNLVLPASVPAGGTPLALFLHGNHGVFRPDVPARANEVRSDLGYAYLQRDLAQRGIASLSVNANVTNGWGESLDADAQQRTEVLALHVALLVALVTGTVPAGSPLRIRLPGRGFVPLGTALSETGPADGPLAKLRALAGALREARIDFGRVGAFGHSRGAWSVMHFAECAAVAGGRPGRPPNDGSGASDAAADAVADVNVAILRAAGHPTPAAVRALVAFEGQADSGTPLTRLPELFLVVVTGTHDEDVGTKSIDLYEVPVCPKAAVVVYGGSHARFNTVWRANPETRRRLNRTVGCQDPIRAISDDSSEQIAKSFVNDLFEARLAGAATKLLLYTGERRAPVRVDVARTWLFAHPIARPGGLVNLDGGVTIANPSGSTPVTRPKDDAPASFSSQGAYRQDTPSFCVTRPARTTADVFVRVGATAALASRTHFSFRMCKVIDVTSAAARNGEPMRNFELELQDSSGARIGSRVPGAAVRSVLQRTYPAKVYREESGRGECTEDTETYLQTAEVALSQFGAPAGGLARVARIVVRLLPATTKRVDQADTFRLTDFTLTTRTGI